MQTIHPHTIYELLESFDSVKVSEALELLKADESLIKTVEQRYLYFIRARLNDPKASIFDYPKAALTEAEYQFMLEKLQGVYDNKSVHLTACDTLDIKLIVDVIGALVRAHVKLLQFVSKVKQTTEAFYIPDVVVAFRERLETALGDQLFIHPEGWYARLCAKLYNITEINALVIEDIDPTSMNNSLSLEAFMLFLILNQKGETTFNIGTNHLIDFTKLFWMFINIPDIHWPEAAKPVFPNSVLTYTRVAAYQMAGDASGYYYGEK